MSPSLSAGAVAGITVGGIVGLGLVVAVLWFSWRRRRRSRQKESEAPVAEHLAPEKDGLRAHETCEGGELSWSERKEMPGDDSRTELDGDSTWKKRHEMPSPMDTPQLMSRPVYEMAGDMGVQELAGTWADGDQATLYTRGM